MPDKFWTMQQIHPVETIIQSWEKEINPCQHGILKTLAYFDIFHYPLRKEEILQFNTHFSEEHITHQALHELVAEGSVFKLGDFYSLHNNPLLINRRLQGNQRAGELLTKALSIGKMLYKFPFVRGIGVSGSLSKNVAEENADIDFFIITRKNRLWIARTIMHIFKKFTYLVGRQHFFCMNYYLDEEALLLTDQNIFTAMEIKTLLPVSGNESFRRFFSMNQWANQWLPVCSFREQAAGDARNSWFKKIGEWLFNSRLGNRLDDYLLRITTKRWKKKEKSNDRTMKGTTFVLITDKHFAKSNAGGFQEKVLKLYREKLERIGLNVES